MQSIAQKNTRLTIAYLRRFQHPFCLGALFISLIVYGSADRIAIRAIVLYQVYITPYNNHNCPMRLAGYDSCSTHIRKSIQMNGLANAVIYEWPERANQCRAMADKLNTAKISQNPQCRRCGKGCHNCGDAAGEGTCSFLEGCFNG